MIFLHELGHYLTAKWSGMKVTEFFLFFGPKIWSFKRGETEYGIKCIPLGAYVRIIGMSNLETDVAARGRAPHLPPAVVPEAAARRVGRLDHALPPGVRPVLRRVLAASACPATASWPSGLGGPSRDEDGVDRRQRHDGLGRRRPPGSRSATTIVSIDGEPVAAFGRRRRRRARRNPGDDGRPSSCSATASELELEATLGEHRDDDPDDGLPRHRPHVPRAAAPSASDPIRGVVEVGPAHRRR